MKILGIESSCDETAFAIISADIIANGQFNSKKLLSNVVFSQIEEHKKFGGVFPEIASRLHLDAVSPAFKMALDEAQIDLSEIDAVAATCGPGLIGSLVVGASFGKALAAFLGKPFIPVNHLIGHAMMPRFLYDELELPYLLVLASGGHSLIGVLETPFEFEKFGATIDDSAGECFDKVARTIGLSYPGGPNIEKCARNGDSTRFNFPIPLNDRGCNFSFSGLKTAVLNVCNKYAEINETLRNDIAASFQKTVSNVFQKKIKNAITIVKQKYPNIKSVVFSGGVAANRYIADSVKKVVENAGFNFYVPDIKMCTDNAVMIAWSAFEMFSLNQEFNDLRTDILEDNVFI